MNQVTRVWLGLLCLVAVVTAEEPPETSSMLKVPAVEARPTGAESDTRTAAPAAPVQPPEEAVVNEPATAAEETAPAEDGVVPEAFPLSRYESLWKRSPFQLESAPPPTESASLAQRLALTGLAAINGEPIAFLMDRTTQRRIMVRKDGSEAGLSLVQVDVQKKYDDSTATVRQGSEIGVLRFDASAAAGLQPMMQQPVPPPTVRAMAPGAAQSGIPQTGPVPPVPAPPGIVPPVPGPGVPQQGQVQADPGQMPPPRVIRRRALIPAAP